MKARTVRLIPAAYSGLCRSSKPSAWLFFGENYVRLMAWERLLGKENRMPTAERLHAKAWALRTPYLEWLEEQGKDYRDDPAWWYSGLVEKDTTCNDFFVNLCRLSVVNDLHESGELPDVIVVESWSLLLALERHLEKLGCEVSVAAGAWLARTMFFGYEWTRFCACWVFKLGAIARRVSAARLTRSQAPSFAPDPGKPRALLFFWVNDANMEKSGALRNAYFTRLPDFLKSRGYDIVNIARPHKIRQSFRSAFSWLRARGDVIVPEDFMSWRDTIGGMRLLMRMVCVPRHVGDFQGIGVRDLVMKERLRQSSHVMLIQFLAYGTMIAKLKASGFRVDAFLFPFENMALEKPITAALHRHYPDARIVGFQHTTVTPFMLKFSAWKSCFSAGEHYFPDEIVCNGPGYRQGLAASGFPLQRMSIGPALRYLYLWQEAAPSKVEPSVVLVTLPLSFSVAVEVLGKALELARDRSIPIAIKAHPFSERSKLLAKLGMDSLPDGVQWCEGSMSDWLPKAICMLSLGSGTLVEAVCSGVPIVVLGAESGLEFNPLGWWEKEEPMFAAASSLEEVRQRIRFWMHLSPAERVEKMKQVASFMLSQFSPWNEQEVESLAASWLGPAERDAGHGIAIRKAKEVCHS